MAITSVGDLLEVHADIERALVGLRMAAMAGDGALARAWWDRLEAVLTLHLRHEEELLLPVWATVPEPPPNGTAAVLRDEHRRIEAQLRAVGEVVAPLQPLPLPLAERASALGGTLEHHDAREAAGFVPGVAALLAPDEAARVVAIVTADLARLPPPPPLPGAFRLRPAPPAGQTVQERLAALRLALATDGELGALPLLEAAVEDRLARGRGPGRTAANLRRALRSVRQALAEEADPVVRRLGRILAWDRLRLLDPLLALLSPG